MLKIIAFGETLLDIVHNGKAVLGAFPGGSILNTAVSIARCGLPVKLLTEISEDGPGKLIKGFIAENGIDFGYACEYETGKTAIAFAMLDEAGVANYTFYKDYPNNRFSVGLPEMDVDSLFVYGSFSALDGALVHVMHSLINSARDSGSILYYDPNLRKNSFSHFNDPMSLMRFNLFSAHIIRGSDEDFRYIFNTDDIGTIWEMIQPSVCRLLIVTRGSSNLHVLCKGRFSTVHVPELDVVSTIGAGDAFNAGVIAALSKMGLRRNDLNNLSETQLLFILGNGISFATEVCGSHSNYIAVETGLTFQNARP
jgi:fructokinase